MGSLNFTLCELYDTASEIVGIKSGLLLNYGHLQRIAVEEWDHTLEGATLKKLIRIRSEDAEEFVRLIRIRIGNLRTPSQRLSHSELIARYGEGCFEAYAKWLLDLKECQQQGAQSLQLKDILDAMQTTGLPQGFLKEMETIIFETYDRSIILPKSITVTDATPLEQLFKYEAFPKSDNTFLDQKFIDYLAANGNEIETIHWRNFERFCAEYFQRMGYKVNLGPGGNDGGIDIRAYNEQNASDPQIVIQCKRYKKERKVAIETIKAFYTDVLDERAQTGLIATTSTIAPGGRKTVVARNYPITFAEKEHVQQWARQMWRFQ